MSEILITRMEMPNTCRRCIEMGIPVHCRIMKQEAVTAVMSGYERPSDCPLVEVPPHGDLIDRQKLLEIATAPYGNFYGFESLIRDIKNAPTIIEASCENS